MLRRIKTVSWGLALALFFPVLPKGVSAATAQEPEARKIVTFAPGTPPELRVKLVEEAGGTVVSQLPLVDGVVASFTGMAPAAVQALKAAPAVEEVEPDEYRIWLIASGASLAGMTPRGVLEQAAAQDHDSPDFVGRPVKEAQEQEQSKELPWGVARVGAPAVWERATGSGVKVGVIDTGVDGTHPDISPNYAGGYNAVNPEAEQADEHGHGTHVAGTIGAASNGVGVVGVAPQARIYGIKVLDGEGGGTLSTIIRGLSWAVENKMQVVNMSLGGPPSDAVAKAVRKAHASGLLIVAASGNDPESPISSPAMLPESIAVGASTAEDGLAGFTSTGAELDFIAPGHEIVSSWPGRKLAKLSGTSMACPHVTGLAALAISLGANGPEGVRAALRKAAVPLKDLSPEQQGAGMIDAGRLGSRRR